MENESRGEIQWVARKIYKKFHLSKKGDFIAYEIDDFSKDKQEPSYSNQLYGVLYKMEEAGAIKIHKKEFRQYLSKTSDESKVNFFEIEILQPKFDEFYKKYDAEIQYPDELSGNAVPEFSAGDLAAFSDGTIRYKGKIIKMRKQLKYLCRIFIEHPGELVGMDTIRDGIIRSDKRSRTAFRTISKYVSELHNLLRIHFRKDVILNQQEEGWYFNP